MAAVIISCSKSSPADGVTVLPTLKKDGEFTVAATGGPLDNSGVTEVNVVFRKIQLVKLDDTFIELLSPPASPIQFDLLKLSPTLPTVIGNTIIPAGQYKQIKFHLGDAGSVKYNNCYYDLDYPENFHVNAFFQTNGVDFFSVVYDFDVLKSLRMKLRHDHDWGDARHRDHEDDDDRDDKDEAATCDRHEGRRDHGDDAVRFRLKPVVNIVSTSQITGGPFLVSGLLAGNSMVANMTPAGTIHFLTSLDTRFEIRGHFFYDTITRLLQVTPDDIACVGCGAATVLPASAMTELQPFTLSVSTWNQNTIAGTVSQNGSKPFPVSFQRTASFTISPNAATTAVAIIANYPNASYNGKIGVLVMTPPQGNRYFSLCNISNQSASFALNINNADIGVNTGDLRVYNATLYVANDVSSLQISAVDKMIASGIAGMSTTTYDIGVRLSGKTLSTSLTYVENFQ